MTTIKIDIPDALAAALRKKASAEGITLEEWVRRKVHQELRQRKSRYTLAELVAQCDSRAAVSVEDREWADSQPFGREAL